MGTPDFAVEPLKKLAELHEVCLVVSQPDAIANRGLKKTCSPVKSFAESIGLDVFTPESINAKESVEKLKSYDADLFVVAAYGQILKKEVLEIPKKSALNIHASVLPKLRGAAPIHWAVINGFSESGVSIMEMEESLDSGPVLASKSINICNYTSSRLHDELSDLGADLICEVLDDFNHYERNKTVQDDSKATYAPKISKSMGHIDWNGNADEIVNLINGMDSFPGAYSYTPDGGRIKVFSPQKGEKYGIPGEIVCCGNDFIEVACKDRSVLFKEIQSQGKRRMSVKDYLSGNKIKKNSLLR